MDEKLLQTSREYLSARPGAALAMALVVVRCREASRFDAANKVDRGM